MYIDSSACVRVKRDESERFRIDRGERQGCIISPWLFNVYFDAVLKEASEIPRGGERVEFTLPLVSR